MSAKTTVPPSWAVSACPSRASDGQTQVSVLSIGRTSVLSMGRTNPLVRPIHRPLSVRCIGHSGDSDLRPGRKDPPGETHSDPIPRVNEICPLADSRAGATFGGPRCPRPCRPRRSSRRPGRSATPPRSEHEVVDPRAGIAARRSATKSPAPDLLNCRWSC